MPALIVMELLSGELAAGAGDANELVTDPAYQRIVVVLNARSRPVEESWPPGFFFGL